jgi:hypothetical protein
MSDKLKTGDRVELIEPRTIGPNQESQKGVIPEGTTANVLEDEEEGWGIQIELDEEFRTPSSHTYKVIEETRENLRKI